MFDIGLGELFLCFVVALVVLGPERLPKVARMAGKWTGQARSYMRNLSAELERETHAAEIKQRLEEANRAARAELASFKTSVDTETAQMQSQWKPEEPKPLTAQPPADTPQTKAE
ncbi:MAG: Sec-independent protein translocase protein TatB [Stagnimonas sp.]|nr:Sec-independent protein translocase protein TatB [Stagnimonas sp.]